MDTLTRVLKRAVNQAIKGRYDLKSLFIEGKHVKIIKWHATGSTLFIDFYLRSIKNPEHPINSQWKAFSLSDLIFNHPFMKAVFGEGLIESIAFPGGTIYCIPNYLYRILMASQLPTPTERLKYLDSILEVE